MEKLKKVGDRTVSETVQLEEDQEESEETVIWGECDEVSIIPVLYTHGTVSISSLGYFSSVGSSSKPSHYPLSLSIGAHHIQECFKKERERNKNSLSQSMKRPGVRSVGKK